MSNSPRFQWSLFLDFAKQLVSQDKASEAVLRSAISRAYYAAYHCAKMLLIAKGKDFPTGHGTHSGLWKICQKECGIAMRPIGSKGKILKSNRESADYEDRFPGNIREKAKFIIKTATYIVDESNRIRELLQRHLEGSKTRI